jgi:hypothetical protein
MDIDYEHMAAGIDKLSKSDKLAINRTFFLSSIARNHVRYPNLCRSRGRPEYELVKKERFVHQFRQTGDKIRLCSLVGVTPLKGQPALASGRDSARGSGERGFRIGPLWRGQALRCKCAVVSADATVADSISPIDQLL